MSTALSQLSEWTARTSYEDLPEPVVERAKLVIMDTLGVVLGGSQAREVQRLATHAHDMSRHRVATMFGQQCKADPGWASLVNATAGTTTELDEGHAFAKGHPAIHVLPIALAIGEHQCRPGREVITSIVLGYEVAARMAVACDLRPAAHPHGTWGTLGAAAAAARLLGFSSQEIEQTINIASSLTLATSFRTAIEGALVRNIYAGASNQTGLFSAQLHQLGFSGELDGPATVFGKVMSDTFNETALTERLGDQYEILRGYFKSHSCCRYNHAALDALIILRNAHSFDLSEVTNIKVETYALAAALDNPRPTTTLGARFSIPYAVAIALVRRSTSPSAFDSSALTDSRIQSLAEKVQVQEDPELTALTPQQRPARVTIQFADQRSVSQIVHSSRGDPDQPFSKKELVNKYLGLAYPIIGEHRARTTLDLLEQFDSLPTICPLTELLARA